MRGATFQRTVRDPGAATRNRDNMRREVAASGQGRGPGPAATVRARNFGRSGAATPRASRGVARAGEGGARRAALPSLQLPPPRPETIVQEPEPRGQAAEAR